MALIEYMACSSIYFLATILIAMFMTASSSCYDYHYLLYDDNDHEFHYS